MQDAIMQANIALKQGDVPIGAVVVRNNRVIAVGHNCVERKQNTRLHAEMVAMDEAYKVADLRFEDCDLYTTLEPCTMCFSAICLARIRRLYIGASDAKYGAISAGSLHKSVMLNHKPELYIGIMEEECGNILEYFFAKLRVK